jgi:hypothetical protein
MSLLPIRNRLFFSELKKKLISNTGSPFFSGTYSITNKTKNFLNIRFLLITLIALAVITTFVFLVGKFYQICKQKKYFNRETKDIENTEDEKTRSVTRNFSDSFSCEQPLKVATSINDFTEMGGEKKM